MKLQATILILFSSIFLIAQEEGDSLKHFNIAGDEIAVAGYDLVSYFNHNLQKGKKSFQFTFNGRMFYFASSNNREKFISSPAKYLPQYGGWCAFAMGDTGEKVEINPKTYKIIDGKLYLFYNKYFTNTLDSWNEDEYNLRQKADKNWNNILR